MTLSSHRSTRRILAAALATGMWVGPASAQVPTLPILDVLADLDTRVTLANGRIAVIETQATVTAAVTAALDTRLQSLTNTVVDQGAAVVAINGKLAAHDAALATLGTASAATAAQLSSQAQAIGVLDGRVSAHDAALAALGGQAGQLAGLDDRITGVVNAVADVSVEVDRLGLDLAATTDTVVAVGTRLTGVEGTLGATVQAVADLGTRTAAQGTAIAALDVRVGDNSAAVARERSRNDAQDGVLADHATRIDRVGAVADASMAATSTLRGDVAAGRIGVVQIGAGDTITVGAGLGGSAVSVAGAGGARRISGVAAGTQADDVATVGQLTGAMASTLASANLYTDQQVLRALDRQMGTTQAMIADNNAVLRREMNGVAAHGAALSGLPQATVPGRGFAGMSLGGKGGEVALALGVSKAFLGDHAPVLKAGAAVDTRRGDMTYNAGVGIHF